MVQLMGNVIYCRVYHCMVHPSYVLYLFKTLISPADKPDPNHLFFPLRFALTRFCPHGFAAAAAAWLSLQDPNEGAGNHLCRGPC